MKSLNQLAIITAAIILAFGHINGLLFIDNYGDEKLNIKYLWPVLAYVTLVVIIGFAKLVIKEGNRDNGPV